MQPAWVHPQRYGTIHRIGLRQGGAYALPDLGDVGLLHFRYRWMHTFGQRLRRSYTNVADSSGAAIKRVQLARWLQTARDAEALAHGKGYVLQLGLLRHVADLRTALALRWERWRGPVPSYLAPQIEGCQQTRRRVAVLIVAEARSGSTLLGELAFGPRRDFTYLYEPCRLRSHGQHASSDGRLHGAACARAALDALSCRLSLASFQQLRADRNAFSIHSSAGRTVASSPRLSLKGAYVAWAARCWRTHGAAKVVRLQGLQLPARAAPPGLRVLLLLRDPAEVT